MTGQEMGQATQVEEEEEVVKEGVEGDTTEEEVIMAEGQERIM